MSRELIFLRNVSDMVRTWAPTKREQDTEKKRAKRYGIVISRTPVAGIIANVTNSERDEMERKSVPERSAPNVTHIVLSATTGSWDSIPAIDKKSQNTKSQIMHAQAKNKINKIHE